MMTEVQSAVRSALFSPHAPTTVRADADGGSDKMLTAVASLTSLIEKCMARMDSIEEKLEHREPREDSRHRADDEEPPKFERDEEAHSKLDAIAERIGDLHARHDSHEDSLADLHAKHDAMRADHEHMKKRLDALEAEEEEPNGDTEKLEVGASDEPAPALSDSRHRSDDEENPLATEEENEDRSDSTAEATEGLEEEREENGLKANDSRRRADVGCSETLPREDSRRRSSATRADSALLEKLEAAHRELEENRRRIASLERRAPAQIAENQRALFAEVQARADKVMHAFGDSSGVRPPVNGESLVQYRRALLRPLQKHSPAWKDVDLTKVNDETALRVAETQIYADASAAALHPVDPVGETLRQVIEEDRTGRKIIRWSGSPRAAWAPFKHHRNV